MCQALCNTPSCTLNIALLATLLQILTLQMTKLRLTRATEDLHMLISQQLLEPGFEPGSEINAYKRVFHLGPLLTASTSWLPLCAPGFTILRERMLLHLKATCSHLYRIFSANILLLGNRLLNLITSLGLGRHRNHHLLRMCLIVLQQTLSPRTNLSSSSIITYVTGLTGEPPTSSPHEKSPLCVVQRVISKVKLHCNV